MEDSEKVTAPAPSVAVPTAEVPMAAAETAVTD